jgi:hypothetical protein
MSKKTISFNMPVRVRPSAAAVEQSPSRSIREMGGSSDSGSDWVDHPDAAEVDPPAPIRKSAPPAQEADQGLLVDLMAERELAETIALSFAVPSILGWNWLAKWVQRMSVVDSPSSSSSRL